MAGIPTPDTWAEQFESLERINSTSKTNGSFCLCNSGKRLAPSRLRELYESKIPFVSRMEFIHSKLSILSAHVSVVPVCRHPTAASRPGHVPLRRPSQQTQPRVTAECWQEVR